MCLSFVRMTFCVSTLQGNGFLYVISQTSVREGQDFCVCHVTRSVLLRFQNELAEVGESSHCSCVGVDYSALSQAATHF